MAGIYIHVPFCVRKCPYCDFYSGSINEGSCIEYVSALKANLLNFKERHGRINAETVYFGGGTPTVLPTEELCSALYLIKDCFNVNGSAEITVEANPGTVSCSQLSMLSEAGFNRLSFGVQSLVDGELKALGRIHTAGEAKKAIIEANKAGFKNISADLMLGIPMQTEASMKESIEMMSELPLSHISAYMLKIEEGTPFDCDQIKNQALGDDEMADRYLSAVSLLEEKGFFQYEISNFSKKGFEGKHNLNYWRSGEYLGFGPSAHSYFGGKRFAAKPSLTDFTGEIPQKAYVTDGNPGGFFEYAMLKIRLSEGLDLSECTKKFGVDKERILRESAPLEKAGLLKVRNSAVSLTPRGFLVSNGIIGRLFGGYQDTLQEEK